MRKKFLNKTSTDIILIDVDSIRDFERYSLLLDKFDNSVVFLIIIMEFKLIKLITIKLDSKFKNN